METNKSKNLILILLFIVLLINISLLITFLVFPRKNVEKKVFIKEKYHKDKIECLMKDMNMDKNQEEDFFKLRDEHKTKLHHLFTESKKARSYMIDELSGDKFSSAGNLYFIADSLGQIETKIQRETIDYFFKMKQLLNNEQFDKLLNNFREVCGCDKKCQMKTHHDRVMKKDDSCKNHRSKNHKY